jgi:hypothetical protein
MMSLTVSRRELHDRLDQATAAAAVARERAIRAVAEATDIQAHVVRVRLAAIETRARRGTDRARRDGALGATRDHSTVRAFHVKGLVDGVPAHASWSERGLECSPALFERMEIVVALEDTFDPGGDRPVVQASLHGPLKAVLPTIIRAFSSVASIELAVGSVSSRSKPS